jgi:hypothetical protein
MLIQQAWCREDGGHVSIEAWIRHFPHLPTDKSQAKNSQPYLSLEMTLVAVVDCCDVQGKFHLQAHI